MQSESNLDFSSGMTILPGLSFKSGKKKTYIKIHSICTIIEVPIVAVCFFQDKPEQVAVFYEPVC
jgi:hypothetical protein